MKLELFIARRYLFSKKSSNAVNIISWISVFSIAMATFALVTVLSAFNGLQDLVESMYESFEPDVKISAQKGKWFELGEKKLELISGIAGVENTSKVLEELTLAKYGESQSPCTMKGVEEDFINITHLDESIVEGTAELVISDQPAALVGYGISSSLGLYVDNHSTGLKLYVPRLTTTTVLDPSQAFHVRSITPSGVYLINPDIDHKYIIVPLTFAQNFLKRENQISSLELKVSEDKEWEVKTKLQELLGNDFKIETRFELNDIIYQTNQAEKTVTFVILSFILLIAAFNVISTLTMILLEKKADIDTLKILGFENSSLRKIFLSEGLMINFLGASIGIILGTVVCLLQMNYGLVRLEGGIVDFYPVKLLWTDFALIIATVFTIGTLASFLPSRFLIRT